MGKDHALIPQSLPVDTQIHLWTLSHVPPQSPVGLPPSKILNNPERERQANFATPELRYRYRSRREMVRRTLSLYRPEIHETDWVFSHNALGKPSIHTSQCNRNLYFNLSHTRGMTVLAVAGIEPMGIDIENTRTEKSQNHLEIAKRFFTPLETEQIKQGTRQQQIEQFFDYWTLKEAYIKAVGKGLSLGLDRFQFLLNPGSPITIDFPPPAIDDAEHWCFHQETLQDHFRIAIALKIENKQPISLNQFKYVETV